MAKKNNSKNVHLTRTKVSGTVFVAPVGTALPESASAELDEKYENVGYIGEDGITNSTETDVTEIKELGGSTVLSIITSYSESYQFVMVETNKTSMSLRYESANVTGEEDTGLKITHKMPTGEKHAVVIDLFLTGGKRKRICIASASVKEVGDITYAAGDAIGYDVTLACDPDDEHDGATAVEYVEAVKA